MAELGCYGPSACCVSSTLVLGSCMPLIASGRGKMGIDDVGLALRPLGWPNVGISMRISFLWNPINFVTKLSSSRMLLGKDLVMHGG